MAIDLKTFRITYNYHINVLACLLIIILGLGSINILHAEPFMRVYKQGVIHYYFSNKYDINSLRNLESRPNNPSRLNRPLTRNKLSAQELEPADCLPFSSAAGFPSTAVESP